MHVLPPSAETVLQRIEDLQRYKDPDVLNSPVCQVQVNFSLGFSCGVVPNCLAA